MHKKRTDGNSEPHLPTWHPCTEIQFSQRSAPLAILIAFALIKDRRNGRSGHAYRTKDSIIILSYGREPSKEGRVLGWCFHYHAQGSVHRFSHASMDELRVPKSALSQELSSGKMTPQFLLSVSKGSWLVIVGDDNRRPWIKKLAVEADREGLLKLAQDRCAASLHVYVVTTEADARSLAKERLVLKDWHQI
jgi:hypothetical protein